MTQPKTPLFTVDVVGQVEPIFPPWIQRRLPRMLLIARGPNVQMAIAERAMQHSGSGAALKALYAVSATLSVIAAIVLLFPIIWFGTIGSLQVLVEFVLAALLLITIFMYPRWMVSSAGKLRASYGFVAAAFALEMSRLYMMRGDEVILEMPDALVICALTLLTARIYFAVRIKSTIQGFRAD